MLKRFFFSYLTIYSYFGVKIYQLSICFKKFFELISLYILLLFYKGISTLHSVKKHTFILDFIVFPLIKLRFVSISLLWILSEWILDQHTQFSFWRKECYCDKNSFGSSKWHGLGGVENFLNPSFQIKGYHKINLRLGKTFLPID